MRGKLLFLLVITASVLLAGCSTTQVTIPDAVAPSSPVISIPDEVRARILAMDPEQVSGSEVEEILSISPAPRVINIHGGIYPVHVVMESFSEFLVGMGYPEDRVRNPGDGSWSFSCYENSKKIAGAIAWYYEQEGMRPLMVGHSQGGMQAVKVLHELAGSFSPEIAVWNPLTGKAEQRYKIREPLTGQPTPVVGLHVSYATAVGAGGLTRFLPNQWKMRKKLRRVPDSVIEFTGFYMPGDLLGGDNLGYGSSNYYEPVGSAMVRNVQLSSGHNHFNAPSTRHLLDSQEIIDWINNYEPADTPTPEVKFDSDSSNILWAADVWFSIKKHWVLELQRLISAQREPAYAD